MTFRYPIVLYAAILSAQTPPAGFPAGRFYAPYLMPRPTPGLERDYLTQIADTAGIRYFTLAFVIDGGGCHASWGGRTALAQETALAPAIESLRARGGDVLISFGGEVGKELALGCDSGDALQAEYQRVIDRYRLTAIDLDIEGTAIKDAASVDRRNAALAALQTANPQVQISYTLPVTTDGLTASGVALLTNAMSHGVKVAVVNLMTMDYGGPADPLAMGAHAITAVNGTVAQMLDNGIRARIGICPMIGNNDVKPEVFTLADAQQVYDWAQVNPVVVRLTMWSVSRDNVCAEGSSRSGSSCSGISQQAWDFTKAFSRFH